MAVESAFPRGERQRVAAILLAAVLLSVLLGFRLGMSRQDAVGFGLQVPAPGLDLSYTYAMNRAAAEGLAFGRDFVSTYGPHGYLVAGMHVPGILGAWTWAQLALVVALGLGAAAYVFSAHPIRRWSLVCLPLLLGAVHVFADEYRFLGLVVLLALVAVRGRGRGARAGLLLAGFLGGFGLLVKLSLGMGALLTVTAAALLVRGLRAATVRLAMAVVAAASGLLAGQWLHGGATGGLGDYLASAAVVSHGYSSAMSLSPPGGFRIVVAFLVFVTSLVVAAWLSQPQTRVTLLAFGVPLFVAWKHALVRQDGHIQIFVLFGVFILAVVLVDAAIGWSVPRVGPVLLVGLLALLFAWFDSPDSGASPARTLGQNLAQPWRLPGVRGLSLLIEAAPLRDEAARRSAEALLALKLPAEARALVGDQTLDVYPWESACVPANGFRWLSRPSPASFATYEPALDARNAAFFEAPSRPRFLLWHKEVGIRSIDARHLFWDEPLTLFTLLDRYDVAWRGSQALLAARAERRFATPVRMGTARPRWGEWLPLPRVPDGLVAQVELDAPFRARLRRTFFREDPAYVAVRFTNGERTRYRYLPDQGPSGFFIDPLPRNADEALGLFASECTRARVEALRFLGGFRPGTEGPRITFWSVTGIGGKAFRCEE